LFHSSFDNVVSPRFYHLFTLEEDEGEEVLPPEQTEQENSVAAAISAAKCEREEIRKEIESCVRHYRDIQVQLRNISETTLRFLEGEHHVLRSLAQKHAQGFPHVLIYFYSSATDARALDSMIFRFAELPKLQRQRACILALSRSDAIRDGIIDLLGGTRPTQPGDSEDALSLFLELARLRSDITRDAAETTMPQTDTHRIDTIIEEMFSLLRGVLVESVSRNVASNWRAFFPCLGFDREYRVVLSEIKWPHPPPPPEANVDARNAAPSTREATAPSPASAPISKPRRRQARLGEEV